MEKVLLYVNLWTHSLEHFTTCVNIHQALILCDTHQLQATASERALQTELLTPALRSAEHAAPSRELHLQTKAKYQKEMRDDLLGLDPKGKLGGMRCETVCWDWTLKVSWMVGDAGRPAGTGP